MQVDASNMLKALEDFPQQCRTAFNLAKGMAVSGRVDKIVVAGMGGSAVGGDLLRLCMHGSRIPVTVCRDYKMPGFVDENTLVFVKAKMPVMNMLGWSSDLRSATEGRGVSSLVDQSFERLPAELQTKVVNEIKQRKGLTDAMVGA